MPYVFPHEDLFVWGISGLILVLLIMRVAIARKARREGAARIRPDE